MTREKYMHDKIQPECDKEPERDIFKECLARRKLYAVNGLLSVVLAFIICLSVPKEYAARMEVTDEHKISMELSVGLDPVEAMVKKMQLVQEGMQNPETYAMVIESESFLNRMLRTNVDKYGMTYAEYLRTMNKEPWWAEPFITRDSIYSRRLLDEKIRYKLYGKYITKKLQVKYNYPEVAAVMTDSLCGLLAEFLEEHRATVNNAKMNDALIQRREARKKYHEAQKEYIAYVQSHTESELTSENAVIGELTSERDNAFNRYNQACMKYEHYRLAINRSLPYFTVLYNPTVPTGPCSPSWGGYIMALLLITWTCTTWWILYKNSILKDKEE